MENFNLNAEKREKGESVKVLKENKKLPWVVYGKKTDSFSIKMDYSDFLKTFRKSWESHIINLQVNGEKTEVLVHDIQKQPVTWEFTHIDFYAITKGEKVHTKIPLLFVWESKAVKLWDILDEHLKEIEVKCLPKDLTDGFEVDLTKLESSWDSIRVWDLGIDAEKYEVWNNPEDMIVAVNKPAKVEEIPNEAPVSEIPWEDTWKEKKEDEKEK